MPALSSRTCRWSANRSRGSAGECDAQALQRYPVLAEGGWFDVVKCAECLHSASRSRGPRLGPISLLSDLV